MREATQPKMEDNVPLPPEVWARIATHTRSERGISLTGQLCRASRQGVTKSPRPWRMLEKKYGVQRCEDPTRVREAFLRFAEERGMFKDRLLTFADPDNDGLPPYGLEWCALEGVMGHVRADRDTYHASVTALLCDEVDKTFFRNVEVPVQGAVNLAPRTIMGCLCAAYAAVHTSMAVLLVVNYEPGESINGAIPLNVAYGLQTLLKNFDDRDGVPVPKWVVGRTILNGEAGEGKGIRLHMRNSSSVVVCSMLNPLPLLGPYDGIVVCAKHDATFEWLDKTSDSGELEPWLPKHRVHFG